MRDTLGIVQMNGILIQLLCFHGIFCHTLQEISINYLQCMENFPQNLRIYNAIQTAL